LLKILYYTKANCKRYETSQEPSEIIACILEITNGNRVRQTEILYKTYLSHNLLKEYLILLLQTGIIVYIQGERSFRTTGKGMRFLHMFNQMGQLIVPKTDFTKRVDKS
jgi:predicted transcriptional regulator